MKNGEEILGLRKDWVGTGGVAGNDIGTSHKILSKDQSRHMWTTLSGIFSPSPFLSSTCTCTPILLGRSKPWP